MPFAKAQDLLRLAQMAAARHRGISLEDICAEFRVSHRTAQRMTEALDATFPNVTKRDDAERRRYWRLEAPLPDRLQPRQETAIEALEIAARAAHDQGRLRHSRALEELRDGLLARLNPRDALRSEVDAEAVLAGLGQVTRPGPTVALKPAVTEAVIEALRGPFRLRVCYRTQGAAPRVIEPHGMRWGTAAISWRGSLHAVKLSLTFAWTGSIQRRCWRKASTSLPGFPLRIMQRRLSASIRILSNMARSCGASPLRPQSVRLNFGFTQLKSLSYKTTAA